MIRKNKITAAVCAMLAIGCMAVMGSCGDTEPAENGETKAKTPETTTAADPVKEESSQEEIEVSSQAEESSAAESNSSAAEEVSKAEENIAAEEKPYDFTGMAGYWYIDGEYDTAYIHITKDGRFESFYASGSEECSGTVKRELDPNTNNYIFALYPDGGEPYLLFADDGETEKTDLYTAGEYPQHYVKLYGEGGLGDDGRGEDETDEVKPGDEYLGIWGCGRATIHIYKTQMDVPEKDKFFYINIYWGDSAFAHVEWSLVGEYKDGKLICDKNGVKTYVEYQDAETPPKRTVEYTEGSAEFELRDGKLYWNDLEENAAVGMEFINTPPSEDY